MSSERWQKIEEFLQRVLEQEPGQRAAYLEKSIPEDEEMRKEVESLLRHHDEAGTFLEVPAVDEATELVAEIETKPMTGRCIGHYQIVSELGRGGMGEVYLAEDNLLGRKVAMKFLAPGSLHNEQARKRFMREARTAAKLDHPQICSIYEIGQEADLSFIVMQYVEGATLAEVIKKTPLNQLRVLDIAIQVAEALVEAHAAGIIHRDIKPQNIMITPKGQVKVLDFGLARAVRTAQPPQSEALTEMLITERGKILGTVLYMSPEQLREEELDVRSDIFSFGVVLYEMLTRHHPFASDSATAIISAVLTREPRPLARYSTQPTDELQRIVSKSLNKNRDERYESTGDLLIDLKKLKRELEPAFDLRASVRRIPKLALAVSAFGVILLIVGAVWFFNRQANITWARQVALPEIERLIETNWQDSTEAYKLAEQAEAYIPKDPKLAALFSKCSLNINITTDPVGARVYIKEYKSPDSEWKYLGVSPIERVRLPIGVFRWRIEKEGYEPALAAASTWELDVTGRNLLVPNDLVRVLDEKGSIPQGMVRVVGAQTPVGKFEDFFIDRYEVTNKQYKEFIDKGGYKERAYWKQELIKDGKVLPWLEATALFVDQTGRPGPATWQAGDYPSGHEDHPVSGISWYEAAAYAEFVGKTLPTGQHWGLARGEYTSLIKWPQLGGFAIFAPFSNFEGKGPAPVGSFSGVTSYGAYDMAGNVREWCWNETPAGRLIRGGAWSDNTYRFTELAGAPPLDRSPHNGFRCALYPDPQKIPQAALAMAKFGERLDFYNEKPVSDDIFRVYKEQFSYDKKELDAQSELENDTPEWVDERISFTAAYGNERVIAHLFLPKNTAPPYQTIIYFPGSSSAFQSSSADLERYYEFPTFLSFLVKNGRAVLYPIYKGTFERRDDALTPIYLGDNSHSYTEYLIQLVKDFRRSADYLETRQDINSQKLAYYGMSWGGTLGAIIPAVENRLQTSIILGGGLRGIGRPEANQINYVSRVKTPTLMLHGKYDTIRPFETSIKPMFDLLGTPDRDKKLKSYETDHIPPSNEFIKEILAWLDRYLGAVK